jgi:hypothetical protein
MKTTIIICILVQCTVMSFDCTLKDESFDCELEEAVCAFLKHNNLQDPSPACISGLTAQFQVFSQWPIKAAAGNVGEKNFLDIPYATKYTEILTLPDNFDCENVDTQINGIYFVLSTDAKFNKNLKALCNQSKFRQKFKSSKEETKKKVIYKKKKMDGNLYLHHIII